MYYLKCKHCNHLNEVKSEYLVVCGLCNRKLEDNYKDWKVKHPEKSFEDFQREVCLTEEQVKKGDTIKPTGKRGNKKGVIAGGIGGILVMLMILLVIKGMKDSYDELYGDGDTPVLEQQWYTGTYAGGASLATPKAMKSVGNVMNKLPEEVRPLVKEMQTFSYKGNGLEFMYLYPFRNRRAWISALLGMCTKFSEVTLAVHDLEGGAAPEFLLHVRHDTHSCVFVCLDRDLHQLQNSILH